MHVNGIPKGCVAGDGYTEVHQSHERCCNGDCAGKLGTFLHGCDVAHPVYLATICKGYVQSAHNGRLRSGVAGENITSVSVG